MESLQFLVQGSAPMPYEVTFTLNSGELTAQCTCPAGISGTSCKHRESILSGHKAGIVSPNPDKAALVPSWLPGTKLAASMTDLANAEAELDLAKKRMATAKKTVGAVMNGTRRKG